MDTPHGHEEKVFDLSSGLVTFKPETILKLIWTILGGGLCIAIAVSKFAWDANNQLRDIKAALDDQKRVTEARTTDRWTLSMMRKHDDEMAKRNPMIILPDSDEIHTRLIPRQ